MGKNDVLPATFMSSFYSDPAIRRRLAEYLGGDSLDTATAVYVTHSDGCLFQRSELHPPADLGKLMDRELDIARSLADREFLLFHLDIESVPDMLARARQARDFLNRLM